MTNRKQKVTELMEGFQRLHRSTKFRPHGFDDTAPITPSQWKALMVLEVETGSSLKEVARLLGVTSSAATQLIDGLVANGYVVRKEDEKDRRKMTITISSKTAKQIQKMKEYGVRQFLKMFEALNDKEFDQYLALHKKMIQGFSFKK